MDLAVLIRQLQTKVTEQKPQARVYNSANISIPNGTTTALTFNSEDYDTEGIHSTASNTGRLTCVTPGLYQIWGQAQFAANGTGNRGAALRLNGSTDLAWQLAATSTAVNTCIVQVSTPYRLSAGDYVEMLVYQNSGGALNVLASSYSPEFSMAWVSP